MTASVQAGPAPRRTPAGKRLMRASLPVYTALAVIYLFLAMGIYGLVFWMPQVLHSFLGISKVPFGTHFFASLLGYIPPLLLISYLGSELFVITRQLRSNTWPILGGLLAAALLLVLGLRHYQRRKRRAKATLDDPT